MGSMYDALYGSDIIDEKKVVKNHKFTIQNVERSISKGREFLDQNFSLKMQVGKCKSFLKVKKFKNNLKIKKKHI